LTKEKALILTQLSQLSSSAKDQQDTIHSLQEKLNALGKEFQNNEVSYQVEEASLESAVAAMNKRSEDLVADNFHLQEVLLSLQTLRLAAAR
jgi:predicted  nucleic acid-binding Zn-ribbon protein